MVPEVEVEALQREVVVQIQEGQEELADAAVQQPLPCIADSIARMPHSRLNVISTLEKRPSSSYIYHKQRTDLHLQQLHFHSIEHTERRNLLQQPDYLHQVRRLLGS